MYARVYASTRIPARPRRALHAPSIGVILIRARAIWFLRDRARTFVMAAPNNEYDAALAIMPV